MSTIISLPHSDDTILNLFEIEIYNGEHGAKIALLSFQTWIFIFHPRFPTRLKTFLLFLS